jgi:hypothetical protein
MAFDLFFRQGVFQIIANLPMLAFSAELLCPFVRWLFATS